VHRAAAGDITVVVGGDERVFEAHMPLLEAWGGQVFHVGELGSASDLKGRDDMLAFVHLVA
jgi:3-hydroxyisobutyrate dehydrogenase